MRPRALAVCAAVLSVALAASAAPGDPVRVLRAVDGDTLEVAIDGRKEKVRLIGVDTPESVDPRRPVEYYGREAAAFTRRLVMGRVVLLEGDAGTRDRDRYGRLLRYVYLGNGTLVNAEIIKQGYGHAYVRFPFSRMEEFRAYERQAREKGLGLWSGRARTSVAAPSAPRR
jgi:micrococcal nuclease